MATSFNQLFGPNFLQGLSPNQNPDPSILPGVAPAPAAAPPAVPNALQAALTPDTDPNYQAWLQKTGVKPSEDYDTYAAFKAGIQPAANGHLNDSYKRPNHVTYSQDSLSAQQPGAPPAGKWIDQGGGKWTFQASPTNIQNAGGVDQMKRYFDANEQGNTVMLPNGESYVGGSGAAAAPQPPANPGAPGQPDLGQPAAMPQSVMPAHGERKSFASVLQSLSDKVNTSFGSPTTAQMQQAQQLKLQAAMLDNQAKNQDITQTGLENQSTANGIVANFARGLNAIKAAGGDPSLAAAPLAHQLGIPLSQAQQIVEQEQKQPGFLGTLADAADKADKAEKFALQMQAAVDKNGRPVFVQSGSLGTNKIVEGLRPLDPNLHFVDQGTNEQGLDPKTGKPVGAPIPKSGAPQPGTFNTGQKSPDGAPVYKTLPGTPAASNQAKTEAETAAIKAKAAGTGKTDPTQALGLLNNIQAGFDSLHSMGALSGDPGNGLAQAESALGRTGIGQAIGAQFGNAAAQKRIEVAKNVALLQQELIKALPASATRSRFEQEILSKSLPDPKNMSYETAGRIIGQYREIYNRALQAARTAPAAPANTAPTGRWGKVQVVQ